MEYSHSSITILDSRTLTSYPQHHYRSSIFNILLFNINLHTLSATWWNIIWLLCDHTKCSLWMTTSTNRCRLWEWFRHYQLVHPTEKNAKNSTMYPAWKSFIQSWSSQATKHAPNPTYTSMQMAIIPVHTMTVAPQKIPHQLLEQLQQVLQYT